MHGPLSALTTRYARDLEREIATRLYMPGQAISYEGSPALAVYCIRFGQVRLVRQVGRGHEVVVGTRGVGALIGAGDVVARRAYGASAEAIQRSMICTIPRDPFLDIVQSDHPLCLALLEALSEEFHECERTLVSRSMGHVAQRVARLLVDLSRVDGPESDPASGATIQQLQSELAREVGTTLETLCRTLHEFDRRGLIELQRKAIRIRDLAGLRRVAC